jgi:hypothetical protein
MIALFILAAGVCAERGEPTRLNDAIIAKYGETPCLNKVIGQRLTHPTDPHKFLRCMSLESLWIETCPDGLFYNPSMELCDWSSKPRPTTRSNEVVKNRPVLFRTKITDIPIANEIDDRQRVIETSSDRVVSGEQIMETTTVSPMPDVTPSLLEELRKKLNLDTTDRPPRTLSDFIDGPSATTRRPTLRLIEAIKADADDVTTTVVTTKRMPKLRLVEVEREEKEVTEAEFVAPSSTSRRAFLKSSEKSSSSLNL